MIGKILHIGKKTVKRDIRKQVWFIQKTAGGFMVLAAIQPQENFAVFSLNEACKQRFQHLNYNKVVS